FRIIWGTPTISHSLVDKPNCNALYNGMGGSVTCGAGMIFNENPKFVSPESGNFHLSDDSPAVDDGSNQAVSDANILIDLDSLPRIFNATVDLGVFEFGSMVASAPSITQDPVSLEICEGETAVFSVSAAGSLPLVFQWLKNGSDIPGATNSVLTIPDASDADTGGYRCSVTNSTGEVVFSEEATLTVSAPAAVSLSITASQTEICAGEPVIFTALPVNGGDDPVFHWFKNGNLIGGENAMLEATNLTNGDTFTCQLFSSENCVLNASANSNSIVVHVETVLTAALSIASDAEVICENQAVIFTATPLNGGASPSFQWTLDGSPVGGNASVFTTANFASGDQIQ
ncbi:MAG: immunoglobulin domain-containing protein, partial [Bacteroidota bacterium]